MWIKSNVPPKDYEMYDTMEESMTEATGNSKFDAMMSKISNDPWTQLNSNPNWEEEIEDLVSEHIEPWLWTMEKANIPITKDDETLNPGWRKRYEEVSTQLARKYLASKKFNPRDPDLVNKIRAYIDWHTDESDSVHGQLSAYADNLPLQLYRDFPAAAEKIADLRDAMFPNTQDEVDEDYKHKGTAYGGAAQKDDEDEEDDDKPKSKKLGAPKKKDSERSSASLPFGGKSDTGKHKLPAHKGATTRHSMSDEPPKGTPERAEWEEKKARRDKADARKKKKVKEGMSRLESRFRELLGEGRMIDESGETLQHILNRFKHEVKNFEAGGDIGENQDFFDALFDYYCDNGEMPYGTAKARTGDPYDWITDRLARELRTNEAAPAVPGTVPTGLGGLGAVPQTVKPQQTGPLAAVKDTVKGMMGHDDVDHWTMTKPQDESMEPTMEAELNELARLAGLKIADEGNAFTGKLAHTEKGGKFDLDGNTYKDTSTLDEGAMKDMMWKMCERMDRQEFIDHCVGEWGWDPVEMGEFWDNINGDHLDEIDKKSTTLEDIARLSGIAVEGRDYGDVKIAKPAEFANTPEPEVMPANVMLKGGDGEVAGKEKKMSKNGAARFSDNPMESADPLESLGRRLMQAYNSIKIQK